MIKVYGIVQGVGFRPFIYRIAKELELKGSVKNTSECVEIKIKNQKSKIKKFLDKIKNQKPPASEIFSIEYKKIECENFDDFLIIKSTGKTEKITEISPDIAVCADCLQDIQVQKHRIDYPLVNCTNCGPRFSIIKSLPYDREKTTMSKFPMCETCQNEYTDVLDRRFHAQPIACNSCGPNYTICPPVKGGLRGVFELITQTIDIIENNAIVALKGTGGYHLICDATRDEAVERIRAIKNRKAKPLAVMFRDLETIRKYCKVNKQEEKSLTSWRRPIILLKNLNPKHEILNKSQTHGSSFKIQHSALTTGKKMQSELSSKISNQLNTIGSILPYMPFHYLLFKKLKTDAIVFTSANLSSQPVITGDQEALDTFETKVDAIISYNREIHNRVDDSVMFIANQKERIIRRSRGYAPTSIELPFEVEGILATGAELENTFCIGKGNKAILSQHIGDLKDFQTYEFYKQNIEKFKKLFNFKPKLIAYDMHPDYLSTRYAQTESETSMPRLPIRGIFHHHAHIASCMAEHGLSEKVIGVAFDGTGLGDDGNIWGSEFLVADYKEYERKFHLEYIPLPGGDKCVEEPWRTAVSYMYHSNLHGKRHVDVSPSRYESIIQILQNNINSPLSCSMGRLFDAVAALTGICTHSTFHAEAPMSLEARVQRQEFRANSIYSYSLNKNKEISIKPMIKGIVDDVENGVDISEISWKFHNTIINLTVETVNKISKETGIKKVALSGGVFQNKYLLENIENELERVGYEVYAHQKVPTNDGGISLGQIAIAKYTI